MGGRGGGGWGEERLIKNLKLKSRGGGGDLVKRLGGINRKWGAS